MVTLKEVVKGENLTNGNAERFLHKIATQVADIAVLVQSESTGDGTNEWAYLLAQWMGTTFPTHTVYWRLWNNTNGTYDAASTLSTGTGSRSITFYAMVYAGTATDYPLGSRLTNGITNTAADAVIISHGTNLLNVEPAFKGGLMALAHTVAQELPDAQIWLTSEPNTDGSLPNKSQWIRDVCKLGGYGLIDVYEKFLENPTWATDYMTDATHPNNAGHLLWRDEAKKPFISRRDNEGITQLNSAFNDTSENLLYNSRFLRWGAGTTAAPDSWTTALDAGATITQGTQRERAGTSVRLQTASVSTQANFYQVLDTDTYNRVKGRWVTLAARVYPATTMTAITDMRCSVYWSGGATTLDSHRVRTVDGVNGGFIWCITTGRVSASAPNNVTAAFVANGGAAQLVDLTIDRMILCLGELPREWTPHPLELPLASSATSQTIATSGTIAIGTVTQRVFPVTAAGAVTGVIIGAGLFDGQEIQILNRSAFTMTFAAAATSRVADGVTSVLPANRGFVFVWDSNYGGAGTGRWVRIGA